MRTGACTLCRPAGGGRSRSGLLTSNCTALETIGPLAKAEPEATAVAKIARGASQTRPVMSLSPHVAKRLCHRTAIRTTEHRPCRNCVLLIIPGVACARAHAKAAGSLSGSDLCTEDPI